MLMAYNEIEKRGTDDFPFSFYHLDETHPRYEMAAHWHSEIELMRVIEGEFQISLNQNTYTVKKGDIIFINPETIHQGTAKECIYECIVFHADFLYFEAFDHNSFIRNVLDSECVIKEFFPCGPGEINSSLNKIFDTLSSNEKSKKFRIISEFYSFFALITELELYSHGIENNTISGDKKINTLKTILSYLRENYDKPVSLESLSKAVNKSPKYIGCFFKSMTGKTPIEYLNEYRIEKACHKLHRTDMSVTEIAFSCGFSDLSYFIKSFKNKMGMSPGKYRNL